MKNDNNYEYLSFAYNTLRSIGVFSSSDSTRWTQRAFDFYRAIFFIVMALITFLMTVQMFVATDLTLLARTIDIWTMFFSGLYKWFYMTVFNNEFSQLKTALTQIQTQGSMAYGGRSADAFTANYLKEMQKISFWHMFSGMVAAFFIIVSPLLTYPKG